MRQPIVAFLAGVLFAVGLILSGMINPAKVLNFLDVAGQWDPTLMCVMGGALAVTLPVFTIVLAQPRPLLAERFQLPTKRDIDARLVSGALLFGVGWGLAGLCPGPALTGLASGRADILAFVIAMLAGMLVCKYLLEPRPVLLDVSVGNTP